MSIKTRRLLFYSFVFLFLIIGTVLVLNSRGYHLDWKTLQIKATGGIYINSTPTKAQIFIEDESIKNQTGLLQRGTLIDSLASDGYRIRVENQGYSTWEKIVPVQPGTVSVFDAIVLIPDEEPGLVATSTARVMAASGRHLALETGGGVSLNGDTVFGHEIISITESGSLLTRSTATGNYYLANAFEPDENLNLTLTFNNLKDELLGLPGAVEIKKILPYPYNDRRFIVSTERAIYLLDTERPSIEQIALGVSDFYIQGQNSVAWVEDSSIKLFNLPLRTNNLAVNLGELSTDGITDIKNTSGGWLVLDSSGRLLLYSGSEAPQVLANEVIDFKLSPNGEYIAAVRTSGPMLVYDFLEEVAIEISTPSPAQQSAWFKDSAHLLVLAGDNLIFTEISAISPLNQVVLSRGVYSFAYTPQATFVQFSTPHGIFQKRIF
ncbi:MAG: hypothetical protein WD883_02150 [Candidatus Colwellbacteria bacterium]